MQTEFQFSNFANPDTEPDGLSAWREQRQQQLTFLASKLGLPLGHEAEVWLRDGTRLRGRFQLDEEMLVPEGTELSNTSFRIGRATFTYAEVESCVRL